MDGATGALVAFLAFDAGIYAHAALGAKGELERVAEPVALLATAVSLGLAIGLPGRWAAVAILSTVGGRALFDTLHLGDGNVLEIGLPRDYALYSMVTKLAGAAVFILFAFPA